MYSMFRILVVEDEGLIANWICEGIKAIGAVPLPPVPRGAKAVEIALKEKPDLILMDIRLAGPMDGIEAARKIKEKINAPIVFMSGFTTDHMLKNAETVGCIDFLKKPIRIEQIQRVVHQLREDKKSH